MPVGHCPFISSYLLACLLGCGFVISVALTRSELMLRGHNTLLDQQLGSPSLSSCLTSVFIDEVISEPLISDPVRDLGLLCACYYVSSIDWRLKNEKSLYLFKKSLLIAKQNTYKNTIKYSLQFPYIFVLFGEEMTSL